MLPVIFKGHLRLLEMVPFSTMHTNSYWHFTITITCLISFARYWSKRTNFCI